MKGPRSGGVHVSAMKKAAGLCDSLIERMTEETAKQKVEYLPLIIAICMKSHELRFAVAPGIFKVSIEALRRLHPLEPKASGSFPSKVTVKQCRFFCRSFPITPTAPGLGFTKFQSEYETEIQKSTEFPKSKPNPKLPIHSPY